MKICFFSLKNLIFQQEYVKLLNSGLLLFLIGCWGCTGCGVLLGLLGSQLWILPSLLYVLSLTPFAATCRFLILLILFCKDLSLCFFPAFPSLGCGMEWWLVSDFHGFSVCFCFCPPPVLSYPFSHKLLCIFLVMFGLGSASSDTVCMPRLWSRTNILGCLSLSWQGGLPDFLLRCPLSPHSPLWAAFHSVFARLGAGWLSLLTPSPSLLCLGFLHFAWEADFQTLVTLVSLSFIHLGLCRERFHTGSQFLLCDVLSLPGSF